ncbi:hypothetical protein LJC57_01360 [Parabacteroides sp. OttesenSCG-928-G07]|nr:hypothetical protein [Parabacteroides sp. OttesenSCG-928-G07]
MKLKAFFCIACLFLLFGCDDDDKPEIVICPPVGSYVFTFAVDYTTNDFLGGYVIDLPQETDFLKFACTYKSPGDFGSVSWYDETTETELFSGTIIWMGKGKRTFPEEIDSPSSFIKRDTKTAMPEFVLLQHDEYGTNYENIDYEAIWKPLEYLQNVSWLQSSSPAYLYLYRPSVGLGDPKDWYWLVFLEY